MASPSTSLATLRPELAATLMEFDLAMDRQGFIGYRVFPVMDVGAKSGTFGKIPIEQLLKARDQIKRAPGGGYSRDQFTFTSATYACEEYGHEEIVDDAEANIYAQYFDAEMVAAARAFDAVLREAEKRVAAAVFNASTWTGASLTTGVSNAWDDADNATPIDDVHAAAQKVWDGTGMWPNCLIINRKVFKNVRKTDQIVAAITSSGAGDSQLARRITAQQLADAFDLEYVLVAGSAKNTATEGQSASISQIWSDEYAMVCRIATSNDLQDPCVGRTFHWAADGSTIGGTVESYREESKRGDVIRVRHDVDEVVLYTEMGHLLSNITT